MELYWVCTAPLRVHEICRTSHCKTSGYPGGSLCTRQTPRLCLCVCTLGYRHDEPHAFLGDGTTLIPAECLRCRFRMSISVISWPSPGFMFLCKSSARESRSTLCRRPGLCCKVAEYRMEGSMRHCGTAVQGSCIPVRARPDCLFGGQPFG